MSEKQSTSRFQPRHVVGLAAIAAFAVLMQPVASQAAGSLISIADGTTDAVAKVDSAGNLAVSTHSADRPVKIFDQALGITAKDSIRIDVSAYRGVQVYAYPYNAGLTASPATDSLTVTVPIAVDKGLAPSSGSVTLATWASGTPSTKAPGPAQELTRNVPQPALLFTVGTGGVQALDVYRWHVVVYAWK